MKAMGILTGKFFKLRGEKQPLSVIGNARYSNEIMNIKTQFMKRLIITILIITTSLSLFGQQKSFGTKTIAQWTLRMRRCLAAAKWDI